MTVADQMRCERCKRFIGEDCLEGWSGGLFGDYNGSYYCAAGKGCNADEGYNGVTGNSDDVFHTGPIALSRERS